MPDFLVTAPHVPMLTSATPPPVTLMLHAQTLPAVTSVSVMTVTLVMVLHVLMLTSVTTVPVTEMPLAPTLTVVSVVHVTLATLVME